MATLSDSESPSRRRRRRRPIRKLSTPSAMVDQLAKPFTKPSPPPFTKPSRSSAINPKSPIPSGRLRWSPSCAKAAKALARVRRAKHVDRLTFLPDHIRWDILTRLPIKEAARTTVLSPIWACHWWRPPVFKFPVCAARWFPPVLADSVGVDRLSRLPQEIRCEIVSRLPIKDAARTTVLSSSWRNTWRRRPLGLIDQVTEPSPPPATEADFGRKGCDPHKLDQATESSLSHNYANRPKFPICDDGRLPPSPPSATDGRRLFTNMDPATETELRRKGCDPHKLDQATECTLSHIYANLPSFPVYFDRRLPPVLVASDGVDRMSYLPHEIRCRIVSCLPVKDAARTAILSSRWRNIWLSTPLVLIDAHLLPKCQSFRPTPADSPAITAAVSSILETHPGPFRCVHLVCSHMNSYRPQLGCWLKLLAAKGVQELVLVNRPWPHDVALPATVFSITTLTSLYLGKWKLPNMAVLRGVSFPHLRELGICYVFMKHGDVDLLIARSPVLEILNILGGMEGLRLCLVSQSLRCVQICLSKMEDIAVVKAPLLERLVLYGPCKTTHGLCTRVRIYDAPKLHGFGYLEPGQLLEIRDTVIMPGIKIGVRSMVSGVKVLGLNVRFGVRDDVKIVPTFLKCFPNVETLHIKCKKCDKATGYLNLKFWEKTGPIENVVSSIKKMSITEFRGEPSAYFFLESFFQSARVLEIAAIVLPNPLFTPCWKDVIPKVKSIVDKGASKAAVGILCSNGPDGGQPWNIQTGADLAFHDPFSVVWR